MKNKTIILRKEPNKEWRAGDLRNLNLDDPWFETQAEADEWAYNQSIKIHDNEVWVVWSPTCFPVVLYHQGLKFKPTLK